MSEKEKEMREMVETLRKLPDHAQEKIGCGTRWRRPAWRGPASRRKR